MIKTIKTVNYVAVICWASLMSSTAFGGPIGVTFKGTWTTAPGSGNPTGAGGPGMATGQRFVIRVSYDDASPVLTRDILTEAFADSGQDMSVVDLGGPGNSLDIFVPMEGLDGTSPFIYVQDESTHFPAFIPSPTLNFALGSNISDPNNIIGLEFEGNFAGAGNNFIELYNTAAGPTAPVNMVGQILNFGTGTAIRGINPLTVAVDLVVDAGPNIVYGTCAGSRTTASQIVQSNDLGAFRSDGEDFVDATWTEGGNSLVGTSIGNDIEVSYADSGLTSCTDTTVWNVTMAENMTRKSDVDSLNVSANEPPLIDLLKQVSLDGVNFFDADNPGDADVPSGIIGSTDATYRLIVQNWGGEILTNVLVEDATLGISVGIADLAVGETRVLESGDTGFGNLFQPMRCGGTPGNKSNVATIEAVGASSGAPANDDDPANIRCIVGPDVQLLKQVSMDGVNFVDADTAATGPTGLLGADATYRLIVRNLGDEDLTNVSITDTTLGITSETIPDLPVSAEVVINAGSFGKFNELFFPNRCDSAGAKLNVAEVRANGSITGSPVDDDNPAYVNCENPDADNDGITDDDDLCPDTAQGDDVDTNGCSDAQVDGDDDGVCTPNAPSGGPSACTGSDNCPINANPGQEDFDGDGAGDACDDDGDGDGVADGTDACADTNIPELTVPGAVLKRNRYVLSGEPDNTTFQSTNRTEITTTDTGGCSCEQIIDAMGLGGGHTMYGCSKSAMRQWINR